MDQDLGAWTARKDQGPSDRFDIHRNPDHQAFGAGGSKRFNDLCHHLDEARADVGIALSNLMQGLPTPEKVDKAKSAMDAWIKELEAAKP